MRLYIKRARMTHSRGGGDGAADVKQPSDILEFSPSDVRQLVKETIQTQWSRFWARTRVNNRSQVEKVHGQAVSNAKQTERLT